MLILSNYVLSKIVFTIPLSIIVSKTFWSIIKTIGPINNPIIPLILKPVYIAIKVKIGWTPICPLTILGSNTWWTISIITYRTNNAIPKFNSPFIAEIIAQGIITVPDPNMGRASTNPIAIAAKTGYPTFNPDPFKNAKSYKYLNKWY